MLCKKEFFGSKNYKTKEKYNANELIIANFRKVSNTIDSFTPMTETTEQKYIFEKLCENGKIKYREVFTGFIANDKSGYFNIPYVVNSISYVELYPEYKDFEIPKLGLIWIQNDINHSKKKFN